MAELELDEVERIAIDAVNARAGAGTVVGAKAEVYINGLDEEGLWIRLTVPDPTGRLGHGLGDTMAVVDALQARGDMRFPLVLYRIADRAPLHVAS
jgi:hypothetical protein